MEKQSVVIYDNCPKFKAIFSDGKMITNDNMDFDKLCDYIDCLGIDKCNIVVYNKNMQKVHI